MKKKWIILISNILSGMLFLICLGGCKWLKDIKLGSDDPWDSKQKEGEFYYYVQNESATILGLVDEEAEIGELVIPKTLGGYPVRKIGYVHSLALGQGGNNYYGIKAKNIKKIIINHKCYLEDFGFKQFSGDMIVNANVYVWASGYRHHASSEMIDGEYIVANNIQINAECEKYKNFVCFCWEQANVISYEAMGGNLKTFHTIVKDGGYLKPPHDPVREGYHFGGWFKEEEYVNEWNFEEDIVEEDISLYAKWIEE